MCEIPIVRSGDGPPAKALSYFTRELRLGGRRLLLVEPHGSPVGGLAHWLARHGGELYPPRKTGVGIHPPADVMVILADNSKPEASPQIRRQVEELREAHPGVPTMVLLQITDRKLMRELVKVGVSGVILGSVPEQVTVAAIRLVMAGGSFAPAEFLLDVDEPEEAPQPAAPAAPAAPAVVPAAPAVVPAAGPPGPATRFTLREREILDRLRRGMQNKIIAHELGISESTVKVHLRNVMKKMHARNRTQVVFLLGEQA